MWRSLKFITLALKMVGINHLAPTIAPTIQAEAKARNFDPITMVVLIAGESHGNAGKVNHIGCVGLGQVCVKFIYPYCKKATYDKKRCDAKIAQLKNPITNIRRTAAGITANRKMCNKLTRKNRRTRNRWRHWLPSHGGYNKGNFRKKTGVWCGQTLKRGRWVNVPIPNRIQKYMRRRLKVIKAVRRKMRKR